MDSQKYKQKILVVNLITHRKLSLFYDVAKPIRNIFRKGLVPGHRPLRIIK